MAPQWRQLTAARLHLRVQRVSTTLRSSWWSTEEWRSRRPHSTHRADDALDRYAARHHALRYSGSVPCTVPARGLLDIGRGVSTRQGSEKVGIVRPRQHPGDVRGTS